MKIQFLSVGKKHDPFITDAVEDYTGRISRYCHVEWKLIPPSGTIKEESDSILDAVGERDYLVLLDEKGREKTSRELADFLEARLNEGTHRIVFAIGGAYGTDDRVRTRAKSTISLSRMTFPHMLARLIIAEQVYRAFSIMKGEKYHHI